jgi:hypothetical protein
VSESRVKVGVGVCVSGCVGESRVKVGVGVCVSGCVGGVLVGGWVMCWWVWACV